MRFPSTFHSSAWTYRMNLSDDRDRFRRQISAFVYISWTKTKSFRGSSTLWKCTRTLCMAGNQHPRWTRLSEEFLMETIRSHRCLWDHTDDCYSKKGLKRAAYNTITCALWDSFPEFSNITAGNENPQHILSFDGKKGEERVEREGRERP